MKDVGRGDIRGGIRDKGDEVGIVGWEVFVGNCGCLSGLVEIGRNWGVNRRIRDSGGGKR